MRNLKNAARTTEDLDEAQREASAPNEHDEHTRVIRRNKTTEPPAGQSTMLFDGFALTLQNHHEGRHRLGLDLDVTVKGSRLENDAGAFDEEGDLEDEDEEDEIGIEDEEASATDEQASVAGETRDRELLTEKDSDPLEEDEEPSIEDETQGSPEDSLFADDDEEPADDQDLEASTEDDDVREEDDESVAARDEDDALDDDEEPEPSATDDEDEDEGIETTDDDDDDDDDTRAEDDEEDLHDTEREKRAALRSAGDGGPLRSMPTRAYDYVRGAIGSGLHGPTRMVEPKPRPAKRSQADRVIAIAKKQVGVREGKNNYSKFAAELIKDKIADPWWQNQPWCQTFQAWVFAEAGHRKLAPMTPGCATAVAWFRRKKRVNQYPAIGAQVFYGRGGRDHVGLVYKYDPTHIWTVEGNTNDKGSAEGIGVFLKKRSRKSAFGYGYPQYADGIVTADPRKKGEDGFTFKKEASSGAKDTASEPEREEKSLPWVSVKQVQWAATHSASAERAAKAGAANPRDDVKLVQEALEKIMGTRSRDPAGIYGEDTERLFNRFRREKLKFTGSSASAKPGPKALAALGRRSDLFRVRSGSMTELDERSGPTTPARLSARDVTFKRFTTPSSPQRIGEWIREACGKAGATPSSAWVKGYKTIIARESSGNPNACNLWDSNAKTPPGFRKVKDFGDGFTRQGRIKLNGRLTHFQCSRGIVQCIPQTFASRHARGTSRNIYDPVASIAASMRYVMSRYDVAKDGSNLARKVQQADPNRPPRGY